jgi:NFU1 iron-sulfur cluster scaffold homolog, mitochondrial
MFPSRLEILLVTAFFLSISTRGFLSLKINSRNTFRSYKVFTKSQASTFDFDMVRPAVEFDLSQVILVSSFLEDYDADAKIQGVYAVQDVAGIVLYVGASMSMASDIGRLSKKLGSQIVNTLRIQTFPNPKPDAIDAYRFELIRQLSPSGNLENYEMWDDQQIIQGTTSQAVVATEKAGEKEKNSRERLADAVDGDSSKTVSDYVESPFVEGSSDSYIIGPNTSAGMEFTLENVDKVLDEVRPYLIADGGNVEVVSVDEFTRSVSLTLQGACGSCPSSTVRDEILLVIVYLKVGCSSPEHLVSQTTMKMGIERVLNENFANLGPVLQVSPVAANTGLTKEAVEKALEKVLPAIKAMGGMVSVGNVDSATGAVVLRFDGPARLKKGIQLVMADLSLVTSVIIEDSPATN